MIDYFNEWLRVAFGWQPEPYVAGSTVKVKLRWVPRGQFWFSRDYLGVDETGAIRAYVATGLFSSGRCWYYRLNGPRRVSDLEYVDASSAIRAAAHELNSEPKTSAAPPRFR